MRSESATIDDALSYAWFTYDGTRGKEVSQRTHKKMIRQGDVYGIKPLKNGTRYTLVFPDQIHVDFPLTMKDGLFLIERSKKMRKPPELADRTGRKTAGIKTVERQLARKQFDAPRFAPRKIPVESVSGADFGNYQWRLIEIPNYKMRTTKGTSLFQKNDMIGVRFLRETKGGIIINQEGMYLKVPTEEFDKIVQETRLLPIQDWPNGVITVEQIQEYKKGVRRAEKRTESEQREALRLEQRAKVLEQKLNAKNLRKAEREKLNARQAELDKMAQEIEEGTREIAQPLPPRLTVGERRKQREQLAIEEEMLEDDIELDDDLEESIVLDPEEQDLENLFADIPFGADSLGIENTLGSLFGDGEDDARADVDPLFDMDQVEEPEDDEEEEAPKSKVRKKKQKAKAKPAVADAEEEEAEPSEEEDPEAEDETEEDGDPDAEEEDPEAEDETEEDGDPDAEEEDPDAEEADPEEEEDDESEADPEEEDDAAAEEEDPEAEEEPDAEEEDPDAEASDAVEETTGDEEQDDDVKSAEDEAAKQAKEYAEKNSNTPSSKAAEPEEGDVVRFDADAKLKRDWVILRMSTHKSNDNIVVYTVYDITNSPDEVRQVRVNRARKQSLFDIATHIKDMKPALFNQVYDMAENYDLNKDPISS